MRYLLANLFGVLTLIESAIAVCSYSHNAYGDFSFSGGTWTGCTLTLNTWAGVTVSTSNTIAGFSGGSATRANLGNRAFIYGLPYSFTFSAGCGDCASQTISKTPTLCTDSANNASYMTPLVKAESKMLVVVQRPPVTPSGSYCFSIITDSSATGTKSTSAGAACNTAPLLAWPSATAGKTWYVNTVRYGTSTIGDLATSEPSCGVSEVTIPTPACTDALTYSLASWSSVKVTKSSYPSASYKCVVTLTEWSNSAVSIRKVSPDCTSVVFSDKDTSSAFADGASYFSAEYYMYASDKDLNTDNPDCVTVATTATTTLRPVTASLLAADLSVTFPDPKTVRVTISSTKAFPYGTCEVRLTTSTSTTDVPSLPLSRFGPCSGYFDFIVDGVSIISWTGGKYLDFVYLFYPDGDILTTTGTILGPSTATHNQIPNTAYLLPAVTVTEGPVGTYEFTVSTPPVAGGCALKFSDSTPSPNKKTGFIPWPGCDKIRINYYDMKKINSAIKGPGTSFTFTNTFYYNGYSSGASADFTSVDVSKTIYINYGLVLSSATSTSISVKLGSPTSPPSGVSNYLDSANLYSVTFGFYGCDAAAPAGSAITTAILSSFSSPTTFASGAAGVTIGPGQTCYFDVKVQTNADNSDLVSYSGYSGYVTFVAAGAPSWSGVAPPRVMLYGADCVRLVWTKVADPTNAPVTCYLVQAASSSTSAGAAAATATVVRPCSDSNALITDHTYCSLTNSLYYVFSINAVNMQGSSSTSTSVFKLSDLQADETLVYAVTVDSNSNKFSAGNFPILTVSWGVSVPPTNLVITRLLVGVLMNLATLDATTHTVPVYTTTSGQYAGPLTSNQAFPFVDTYSYRLPATSSYFYDLIVPAGIVTKAGQYSVVTYALQGGGLRGQYWSNTGFTGSVTKERVDPQLDFDWGTGSVFSYVSGSTTTQVYDLLSIRWTGFIEAAFSELYTFYFETNAQVMIWIDNVPIISKWGNKGPCSGVCTGQYQLVQSVLTSTSNVGERKFHHIRIDLIYARGSNAALSALANLQWSSASQNKEVIPSNRLFVGYPIYGSGTPNEYTLPTVVIEAGTVDANSIAVSVSSTEIMAQDTFYVNITAKDVYGNVVPTANELFKVEQAMTGQSSATDYSVATPGSLGYFFVPIQWQYPGTLTLTVSRIVNGVSTLLATIPVTISAGPITNLAIGTKPTITAGVNFDLTFTVKDVGSNAVTIASTTDLTPIAITATWTGDSTLSLITPDDTVARYQRYSTTFNPVSVTPSIGTSTVTATMNVPFKGSYTISFVFGDNTPVTDSLTVLEDVASVSGEYSVVTTAGFPPTQLITAQLYTLTVRIRDIYMNPITRDFGASAPTVIAKIGSHQVTCSVQSGDSYSYSCQWTSLSAVGNNLPISITVNGKQVSYIQDGVPVHRIQGPWTVNVIPGTYSSANSLILGLQQVYVVGVSTDLTIVLRDANNNLVNAAPATCPAISLNVAGKLYTLTPVCNNDGTISASFTPTKTEISATVTATVGGTSVTISPSTNVVIQAGFAAASVSTCAVTTTSPMTVGTSVSVTCTPLDVGGNTAYDQGYTLYVAMYMRKQTSTTVTSKVLPLSGQSYTATTGLAPTVSGAYDYYIEFGQPGGLIAKYFQYDDFTQVVGKSTGVITAVQFTGDPELRYTRIDPVINFDWTSEGLSIAGTNVLAVEWTGYIYFPAGTTELRLSGNGYVDLELYDSSNAQVVDYTNFGATTAEFTPAAFTTISASTQYRIRLQYKPPASGSKTITLKYTASSLKWIVPPIYLSAGLPVSSITGAATPITFSAGLISGTATQFTYQSNIVKDQPATFYFYPKDVYSNPLTASSCLTITFSLLDSTGATVSTGVAFSSTSDYITNCNGGITAYGSSSGFYGFLTIRIAATDYSIMATVSATGVTDFTYTVNHISIASSSS